VNFGDIRDFGVVAGGGVADECSRQAPSGCVVQYDEAAHQGISPLPRRTRTWVDSAPLDARGGEFLESQFGSQPAAHFCDGVIYFGHPSGGDDERVLTRGQRP
jgi:hypothetical protein